jgi:hypothetical protein
MDGPETEDQHGRTEMRIRKDVWSQQTRELCAPI